MSNFSATLQVLFGALLTLLALLLGFLFLGAVASGEAVTLPAVIVLVFALSFAVIGVRLFKKGSQKMGQASRFAEYEKEHASTQLSSLSLPHAEPTPVHKSFQITTRSKRAPQLNAKAGFAVLDLETNGLKPWDGILEYAVVLLDKNLNIEGEYTSLVYQKEVNATWLHGIDEEQVEEAPSIHLTIPELMRLIGGRYLVGHNVKFDRGFIEHHLDNGDSTFSNENVFSHLRRPDWGSRDIDTQWIAKDIVGVRKLTDATAALGWIHDSHSALGDARVTAKLLQLDAQTDIDRLKRRLRLADVWPANPHTEDELVALPRLSKDELFSARSQWINQINFSEKEPSEDDFNTYVYAALAFAANYHVSKTEKGELLLIAESSGLTRTAIERAHKIVMQTAFNVRFSSKAINRREQLLVSLGQSFGFDSVPADVLQANGTEVPLPPKAKLFLSGRMSMSQDDWKLRLARKGYVITKDLKEADIVVIGKKDRTNKQIAQAFANRIPILEEAALEIYV